MKQNKFSNGQEFLDNVATVIVGSFPIKLKTFIWQRMVTRKSAKNMSLVQTLKIYVGRRFESPRRILNCLQLYILRRFYRLIQSKHC